MVLNLCSYSHTCVQYSTVMLNKGVLHVRTNSSKSCFQLNQCQTILELMVVPAGINSECTKPLTFQETISMTSPAHVAVLNFFCAGYVYTLVSINNFYLLMNVFQKHAFCSHEFYHCTPFHLHLHYTLPCLKAQLRTL
jgi:hypothetical protein